MRSRQPALVSDTSQDPRWLRRPDDENERSGPKSAICVPITVREELVGVLTLVHAKPNFLGQNTWRCCNRSPTRPGSPSIMPGCMNRCRRRTGATTSCLKTASTPSLITNLEGKIQETNRQAVQVSGRTHEELQGISIWDLNQRRPGLAARKPSNDTTGETISCEIRVLPAKPVSDPSGDLSAQDQLWRRGSSAVDHSRHHRA